MKGSAFIYVFGRVASLAFVFVMGWLVFRHAVLLVSSRVGFLDVSPALLEAVAIGLSGVQLASLWLFSRLRPMLVALSDPALSAAHRLLADLLGAVLVLLLSLVLIALCLWNLPS